MGAKGPSHTTIYLALLKGELRLHGYDNFILPRRPEFSTTHIAVVPFPVKYAQRSAIIFRTLKMRQRREGIEILTLEARPDGKAIQTIEALSKKFSWVVTSLQSFNDTIPGGPYAWFELVKRDQLKLHFEGNNHSLDELRGMKPIRRIHAKLEASVAKPKIIPPPVVPPRLRTIPTPRGRVHNKVDEMTLRPYPEAPIGRK